MKVLLVNAGPHKAGCTNRALDEVAITLETCGIETQRFWVGTEPVIGCTGCGSCSKTGRCIFDDKVNEFLDIVGDYDGFVFGTPVHYAAASGAATSFFDRVFYAAAPDMLRLKPAAAVVSARRGGTTATYDQMNRYFGISEMPIVASTYWNMVHGSKPEDVEQDLEGLQTMRNLARNMAFFLECKQAGRDAGVSVPEAESDARTNFIR